MRKCYDHLVDFFFEFLTFKFVAFNTKLETAILTSKHFTAARKKLLNLMVIGSRA